MPNVTLHHVLTGPAAAVGAVRFDIDGASHILLAQGISVEEQSSLLGELLHPDDVIDYSTVTPAGESLAG